MAIIPVYPDMLRALQAAPPGRRWPAFEARVYLPHRAYFDGLAETYGPEIFGPGGLPGAVERMGPALLQALSPAPGYQMEERTARLLAAARSLLPGTEPDVWLGTLLFIAPAATLSVQGQPAIALGMERFHPAPPPVPQKYWYQPDEVVEMIPHEAAHAARMEVLNLPPTPRQLTLLEMVMLEGTALTFTDQLLGKETLATFMPPEHLQWHRANDALVRRVAAADFGASGMDVFQRYFSPTSPVSGYYVGYSLCREYLDRHGPTAVTELVALPSAEILRRLGW